MCDFYCKDGSVPFHDYLRCKSIELQINGLLTVFNLKFPSTQLSLLRNSQWTGTSESTSLLQLSLIGGHCCKGWAFFSALLPGSLAMCFHGKRNGQKNWLHLFVEEVLLVQLPEQTYCRVSQVQLKRRSSRVAAFCSSYLLVSLSYKTKTHLHWKYQLKIVLSPFQVSFFTKIWLDATFVWTSQISKACGCWWHHLAHRWYCQVLEAFCSQHSVIILSPKSYGRETCQLNMWHLNTVPVS